MRQSALIITAAALCAFPIVVFADSTNISVQVFVAQCTDGIDNDGDVLIDYPSDPGCSGYGDDDETDPVPQACEDGIDNDSDGFTDYPDDPGCDSATDDNEYNLPAAPTPSSQDGPSWTNSTKTPQVRPQDGQVDMAGYGPASGEAYLYIDGVTSETIPIGSDGYFSFSAIRVAPGFHIFSIAAADTNGNISTIKVIPMTVSPESRSTVDGIVLSPTLTARIAGESDHSRLLFEGWTLPFAEVIVEVHSDVRYFSATSDDKGWFRIEIPLGEFPPGLHVARAYAQAGSLTAVFGQYLTFIIPEKSVGDNGLSIIRRADINNDGRVDMADFSIALYWYRKTLTPELIRVEKERFNGDGRLDLRDFSIMAYYWTN